MKVLANLSDIPELIQEQVRYKNEIELLQKINKLIQDGSGKLQIVTDFDYTLTRHKLDNGKTVHTSFGMFRECPSIPQDYKEEDERLSSIYKPIEIDPQLSVEEKTKHMVQWYIAGNTLLKGLKFPRNELKEVAEKMGECYRLGVNALVMWCGARDVPVLVMSAGLGDAVRAALSAADLLQPHVKLVSNFLAMDENDIIVGMKGEVIHTYNKNETAIKNTEYYEMVKNRSNVILMGDNIGDSGMADGMDHCDTVLKIGYLQQNMDSNLQNYLNKFDIVLMNDPTLNIVNAIVKLIL
ncbi:7-methylguanosine phosphate-specific 5'-nucleotidase [Eumeta japonica]|uniref:5'-nucleotidase n=1 Tax=Eumeta variegata TaxID=151549 RepID=A0A4C1T0L9_EUMVA|nr:7-methylguanosine phosphate-specific 5'-nucleotidase [Eumeta japonica]